MKAQRYRTNSARRDVMSILSAEDRPHTVGCSFSQKQNHRLRVVVYTLLIKEQGAMTMVGNETKVGASYGGCRHDRPEAKKIDGGINMSLSTIDKQKHHDQFHQATK
jgi:hypothetical protein